MDHSQTQFCKYSMQKRGNEDDATTVINFLKKEDNFIISKYTINSF